MKKILGVSIVFLLFEGLFSAVIMLDTRDMEQFGFWNQMILINCAIIALFGFIALILYAIKLMS